MRIHKSQTRTAEYEDSGMTLVELMVASGIGVIILAVVGALSLYALRSFTAMSNYTDLDAKSRMALDQISFELRRCTTLLEVGKGLPNRFFRFANSNENLSVKLAWNEDARLLITTITTNGGGTRLITNLTECDSWDFSLFQQTPVYNKTNEFVAYANGSRCKLVNMTWKCTRQMLGKKWQTENVQTAKIVLRNAR